MTTKNIVSDYGAVADADYATATLTITGAGNKNVASASAIFGTAVAGMTVRIGGAGPGGNTTHVDTIASVTNTTHIVLTTGATTALSAASHLIAWGTNNTAAVEAFNTEFAGSSADLTFPAGKYIFKDTLTADSGRPGAGLTSTAVDGTGATVIGAIEFGAPNFPTLNTKSALVQAVARGATSATLVTAGQASRFSVDQFCCLASLAVQGNGFPPNPYYYQFVKITAINGAVISFDRAIADTHYSTYPAFDAGGAPSMGGPATLYGLTSFGLDATYTGFTLVPDEGTTVNVIGKNIWLRNFSGAGYAFNTTVCETVRLSNCNFPAGAWEMDKMLGTVIIDTGSVFDHIQFQSGVPNLLVINDSTVELRGTPKRLVASNWTGSNLALGCQAYGRSNSVECTNCTISALDTTRSVNESNTESTYSISAGVISIARQTEPLHWAVPGTYVTFSGSLDSQGMFRVNSIDDDGVNFNVHTSMTGGWPTVLGTRGIQVHPCPTLTMINCTGHADIVDLSQAGARGKPVHSYSKRSYTGSSQSPAGPKIWGIPTAIEIIVSQAYTGVQGTLTLDAMGQGRAGGEENGALTDWNPQINAKTTGTRTWTLAGGWSGTKAGDSLAVPPAALWLGGSQAPHFSADVSGEASNVRPIISIEITSAQGLIALDVAPLRLRVHA